jgi:sulfate adenylyltransferase subunit 1 (EFTu-like GTPase family)
VEARFIPVSALAGDNVVHRSSSTPWYTGPSLLELLESLPASKSARNAPFRFPVQRVLRPDHRFRGFAGQIAAGTVRPGDAITVLPSGRSAQVERIVTWDGDLAEADAPLSVTLVLDRELDISRGDLIVAAEAPAAVTTSVTAALVWMDQQPLDLSRRYLLKHASHTVPAHVASIEHRTEIGTLTHEPAGTLTMNGIGVVTLTTLRPIAVDSYANNRATGAFILIDPQSNSTVAAGMVRRVNEAVSASSPVSSGPVTGEERAARWGHRAGVVELEASAQLINAIERSLFESDMIAARVDESAFSKDAVLRRTLLESYVNAGVIVLVADAVEGSTLTARAGAHEITRDGADEFEAVDAVLRLLAQAGILNPAGKAGRA